MLRILHDTKYDFIKYWKHAAIATIAFIALGFVLLGVHKERYGSAINRSIEFTGGTLMQVSFRKPPSVDAIRGTVDRAGYTGAEITQFGTDTEYTIRAQPHAGAENTAAQSDSAAR